MASYNSVGEKQWREGVEEEDNLPGKVIVFVQCSDIEIIVNASEPEAL